MKIKIANNELEYVIRNFDLTNCSAEELGKSLLERCENAGWAAAHVAIIVPAAESGKGHDVIVKDTTSHMTMREVAVELMRLYGRDRGEGHGTRSQGIDATKSKAFAFPVFESKRADTDYDLTDPGMTLRDYFAGQALTGLLAGRFEKGGGIIRDSEGFAFAAFELADAMLKGREA